MQLETRLASYTEAVAMTSKKRFLTFDPKILILLKRVKILPFNFSIASRCINNSSPQ